MIKYITFRSALLTGAAAILLTSCFGSFEEINKPLGSGSKEDLRKDNYVGESFLSEMIAWSFPQQENRYQMTQDLYANQYGRYTSNMNDGFVSGQYSTYNAKDSWLDWAYSNEWPKLASNMKELEAENGKENITYAWAEIVNAHGLLQLTDTYGPFPVGTEEDPSAFLSQKEVYERIISDLDHATGLIAPVVIADPSLKVYPDMDDMYQGDMSAWLRFANSLKLRIAIRMSAVAPAEAQALAEKAFKDGVITKNSENATLAFNPAGLYKVSVEWGDAQMSADMDVYLNGYKDPRASKFFSATTTPGDRLLIGALSAAPIGNKATADALYSKVNWSQDKESNWLSAAEVAFLRAEGALLGWDMGGTPQSLYEEGVKLSFEEWGVSGAETYLQNSVNRPRNYTDAAGGYGRGMAAPSDITIKWEESDNNDRKLERIMVQKWLAMFPNGHEAWAQIRRTGYPRVLPLAVSTPGYTIMVANRIPYPTTENVKNPKGYQQMLTLLGGPNNYETKMWWQK